MKIAYICNDPGIPVFGCKGSSIHVQSVTRTLVRQGHEVHLFTSCLGTSPPTDLRMVQIHKLPEHPKSDDCNAREQALFLSNSKLFSILEAEGPFDLVYERYSLWSFAGMDYARTNSIPGVLEVNAPLIEEQIKYRTLVNRELARQAAEKVFAAATTLIAVSHAVGEYLENYPMAQGRIHVVPNGVDPKRFSTDVKPSLVRKPEEFIIGFVGTMKPWHDLSSLVDAFAKLYCEDSNTRLLMVGDGKGLKKVIDNLSTHNCSQAVHFTGAVPPEQIPGLLATIDVAVAPYSLNDQCYFSPLKVYEYMAAGLPVVASRIGQLAELIQDGVNGLLYPPDDSDCLAEKLHLLKSDSELRDSLGLAAKECIDKYYTWDIVVRRILNFSGFPEAELIIK
ncbi:glycosyltransferase family 4 protein [Mastigocoleus testarum]|uniref:Glycosyl transferase family 1 n=1 Tax=Mastigocoleus testarum BC008 TaxID=371196 RepID=A0A0V7ZJZ6_9CYAN|nr:glycosyltransferase family 4 protein [Mastigocoleus testarum]KST64543.1 glycosyl transferase family 1 [Mastigocoleus testarum BC008]